MQALSDGHGFELQAGGLAVVGSGAVVLVLGSVGELSFEVMLVLDSDGALVAWVP